MAKEKEKVEKEFIVIRSYEVRVSAFSRDEAVAIADRRFAVPEGAYIGEQVAVKCGTPAQMKRV